MTPPTLSDEELEVVVGCDAVHPDTRGGQHVAMKCTGVRVTHKPTGISVLANDGRSQHRNRVDAVSRLRDILQLESDLRAARERLAELEPECERLRNAANAELARIRPVYEAACAWLDRGEHAYVRNELIDAIDTARSAGSDEGE